MKIINFEKGDSQNVEEESSAELSSSTFWESPFSKFIIFISVMWWSHHGTDGGGYIIQRMSSAEDILCMMYPPPSVP